MSCAELMGEMSNRDVSGNGGEDEGGAKGGVKGELIGDVDATKELELCMGGMVAKINRK